MRKLLTVAALLTATSAAAQDNKIVLATNAGYNSAVTTNVYCLYETPQFLVSAEETSMGDDKVRKGFAAKVKLTGPFSVQADTDSENAQAKAVYGDNHFSILGGVGKRNDEILGYAGLTYAHRTLKENNNFGFGIVVSNLDRQLSGYGFARLGGFFGGYDFASDGSRKFVVSRPSESGLAVRWLGVRDDDFVYDQINVSQKAEVQGGVDSLRVLQDRITSPGESPATLALNPERFLCRNDQRGSGLDIQLSRTKKGENTSYAGEVVGYAHGNFWVGGTYDNANGDTYGAAIGRTEHPRLGRGRVPYSVRLDVRYNKDRRNVSAGLHLAKRWKF